MFQKRIIRHCLILVLLILPSSGFSGNVEEPADIWEIGVGKTKITPEFPMWMAGYASRTTPSKGVLHDLWAKAIVFRDRKGFKTLLITMDILSIPQDFSNELKGILKQRYGLEKSQIIISSSHTHSGPVVARALKYIYPMDCSEWQKVDIYTAQLKKNLLLLVEQALSGLKPARIYTGNGISRFQVNRRNNSENQLLSVTTLKGPNDYAVPVIKIEDLDKKLLAVIFGYACHPTTLSINEFSGDYPGFAQIELEKMYPGAIALFFQGAGADQNPLPRRSVPLAIQYGKQLAASVECVLSGDMKIQKSSLQVAYDEVNLLFETPLPIQKIQEISLRDDYEGRWAKGMIAEYESNKSFRHNYPFPIQHWRIGEQQLFVLGGESVISYALQLKKLYGDEIFVMSYANDVMGYIPTITILEEGGYEGDGAQRVYGLPAKWDKSIESGILAGFSKILKM